MFSHSKGGMRMIRFENVWKQYDDGFVALKNINLSTLR